MIVIMEVKAVEVDRPIYKIQRFTKLPLLGGEPWKTIPAETVHQEVIKGRRFRRPSDGTDIVVGCSKQAQDIIGIQYEAWENMEKAMNNMTNSFVDLQNKLSDIMASGIWTRLKWVFRRVSSPPARI